LNRHAVSAMLRRDRWHPVHDLIRVNAFDRRCKIHFRFRKHRRLPCLLASYATISTAGVEADAES
jgi:hypothetical protein